MSESIGNQEVEEIWGKFKNAMLVCAAEVCEYRRVGAGGKRSDLWNDKGSDKEEKVNIERFLQNRSDIRRVESMESKKREVRKVNEWLRFCQQISQGQEKVL